MDTLRFSTDGTKLYAHVQTNSSPVVMLSPSPTLKQGTTMSIINTSENFSTGRMTHQDVNTPVHIQLPGDRGTVSGTIVAAHRDGELPVQVHLSTDKSRQIAGLPVRRDIDGSCTTPVNLATERGRLGGAGISMSGRRDLEVGEGQQEESRPNMSRYSSVLNSLTDQDQASMDLEVQSVMFPGKGPMPSPTVDLNWNDAYIFFRESVEKCIHCLIQMYRWWITDFACLFMKSVTMYSYTSYMYFVKSD